MWNIYVVCTIMIQWTWQKNIIKKNYNLLVFTFVTKIQYRAET